jgi:hypothetical protein
VVAVLVLDALEHAALELRKNLRLQRKKIHLGIKKREEYLLLGIATLQRLLNDPASVHPSKNTFSPRKILLKAYCCASGTT